MPGLIPVCLPAAHLCCIHLEDYLQPCLPIPCLPCTLFLLPALYMRRGSLLSCGGECRGHPSSCVLEVSFFHQWAPELGGSGRWAAF